MWKEVVATYLKHYCGVFWLIATILRTRIDTACLFDGSVSTGEFMLLKQSWIGSHRADASLYLCSLTLGLSVWTATVSLLCSRFSSVSSISCWYNSFSYTTTVYFIYLRFTKLKSVSFGLNSVTDGNFCLTSWSLGITVGSCSWLRSLYKVAGV